MNIKSLLTSSVARKVLLAKKNSPAVLFVAGAASMVGSTVLACNATLKLNALLDEAGETTQKIEEASKIEGYTGELQNRDRKLHKVQTAAKIGKLYLPAIALGTFGLGCLTGAHLELRNRNTALMAAYAALDKGFREYRNRVSDAYGQDAERNIRYASDSMEGETQEDGKSVTRRTSSLVGNRSIYARFWDKDTTNNWLQDPNYNLAFLNSQQNYLNDRLNAKGHVLLNDAYDALGLSRTKEGCVVGWVKNSKNGDNYIDFGFMMDDGQAVLDFIVGQEDGLWLDFNVDGIVYDKI